MENKHLDGNGLSEEAFLKSYDISKFDRPSMTVDMLLFTIASEEADSYRKLPERSLRVLLIKRKEHPFIGKWALPGGFVRIDESLEEAAYRELKEETGVANAYLEQLYTSGAVERDPRGRIISTSYISLVDYNEVEAKAGSDAEEAKWFEVEYALRREERDMTDTGFIENKYVELTFTCEDIELNTSVKISRIVDGKHVSYKKSIVENNGLSFDHGIIIQYGIERLRNKLEYTDVVFHLMPELFTLTELQKTFEVILGKDLLKANFRRKTAKFVTETDQSTSDAGHRPSKLFKFNPRWNDL